ncbi:hypothetical protein DL96DRAFT_1551725 [Flagelloscypha sp. PMI_526]|nr:hypothetical protein DL96DRAFT_1551725 [Flagelloscypha sp. PMI_526]
MTELFDSARNWGGKAKVGTKVLSILAYARRDYSYHSSSLFPQNGREPFFAAPFEFFAGMYGGESRSYRANFYPACLVVYHSPVKFHTLSLWVMPLAVSRGVPSNASKVLSHWPRTNGTNGWPWLDAAEAYLMETRDSYNVKFVSFWKKSANKMLGSNQASPIQKRVVVCFVKTLEHFTKRVESDGVGRKQWRIERIPKCRGTKPWHFAPSSLVSEHGWLDREATFGPNGLLVEHGCWEEQKDDVGEVIDNYLFTRNQEYIFSVQMLFGSVEEDEEKKLVAFIRRDSKENSDWTVTRAHCGRKRLHFLAKDCATIRTRGGSAYPLFFVDQKKY